MRISYYCDGMITNWTAHLNDIAQWGNNTDRTGPVEIEARGKYPPADSFWNVLLEFEVTCRYANGVTLFYKTERRAYVRFEGTEGWILGRVHGKPRRRPSRRRSSTRRSAPTRSTFRFKTDKQDFLDAVKTRGQTLETPKSAIAPPRWATWGTSPSRWAAS